jgi:hypothetical protein
MILVINDQDVSTIKYIQHLVERKVPFISLTVKDLVNKTIVDSMMNNMKREATWSIDKKTFTLNDVTGIYNNYSYPERSIFCNFQLEDIEYAREEWHAYLTFELTSHFNCINPVDRNSFTGIFLSLPNQFKMAKNQCLNVPEHVILSGDKDKSTKLIKSNFIIKESLYEYVNYSQSLSSNVIIKGTPVVAIKMIQGGCLTCFVLGDKLYSMIKYSNLQEIFYLDEITKGKILGLVRAFNLKIAELFFMVNSNMELTFYHISPKLNLILAQKYFPNIFDDLTFLLSP